MRDADAIAFYCEPGDVRDKQMRSNAVPQAGTAPAQARYYWLPSDCNPYCVPNIVEQPLANTDPLQTVAIKAMPQDLHQFCHVIYYKQAEKYDFSIQYGGKQTCRVGNNSMTTKASGHRCATEVQITSPR